MKLQILTPEEIVFDGEVSSLVLPGSKGEFQMLKDHAGIVSTLEKGKIKLKDPVSSLNDHLEEEGDYKVYNIDGGILEFNKNKGIIFCH
ncbi:F0F1 ATP synthase subunit epsilon [Apibacter muscae]|uniref:F0F1 ATP synthase subunit epsilon n=1 Tax=Apibacter muscae TaxID=2509004 RepID=A0A563D9F8_9FLAO|nr:F0F1 ATP synthase subunit epsilon [Apibacter muscae]TWP23302.1 F0F1 ATP synthase subunit epsilon [Apibacter muscae]TWP26850.1 F0F1 ATP synthase subunit epsilon [Apibacter muscae]